MSNVKDVAAALEEESSTSVGICSARHISGTFRSVSTMRTVLRKIMYVCYPYKLTHVQELLVSDLPKRQNCFAIPCVHGSGHRMA